MKWRSVVLGILSLGLFSSMTNRHIVMVLINQNKKSNLITLYHYKGRKEYRDPVDYPKTILSLAADRGASYEFYIAANSEIEAAYKSIWEDVSYLKFQKSLKNLTSAERDVVERYFPKVISEADLAPAPPWPR